ncbi:ABC transporter substrate-binding protein [Cohnella cellulosilytica]|uniref:ABC transporter substrate-binding protein n=1 Tax=Cohnella cellulosilytica TaxID=986710 RepID=A0ABW2FG21_9BACL
MKKKYIGAGTALIVTASILAGCGGNSSPEASSPAASQAPASASASASTGNDKPFAGQTITLVTANHPWSEAITPLLPEFEAATGIKVKVENYFEDQLTQKLTVQFTAGSETPDVFMYRPLQDGQLFFKNGWVAPLDDYAHKDADYDFADISASAVNTTTIDGKLAGIPIITERGVLYYRKDLLEQANIPVPKTMEELVEAAKKLHDPGAEMYGFVARGQRSPLVTQLASYIFSEGGDFITDGKASINTPEAVKAMTTYGNLLKDSGPPGVLNMSWPQAFGIFAQGKVAFLTDADSLYTNATDPEKSTVSDKVGFALFPAGAAGSRPVNVTAWALSINERSKNKDAAWELIQWATSKENVLKAQQKGNPGARTSVWDNPEATKSFPEELVPIIKESMQNGVGHDRPVVVSVGEARDAVGEVVMKVITGDKDVQGAADKANANLQAIIDKDSKK